MTDQPVDDVRSEPEGSGPLDDARPVRDDAPAVHDDLLSAVWVDRDLSWIEFNRRVLAEALDDRTPLLERVKFLAIFAANLDEFFMKRIASLREHLTPERRLLLARIRDRLLPMLSQQAEYFLRRIVPELSQHGIQLRRWSDLSGAQQREADGYFDAQVSAALTPLVIHPALPFPFVSNLSLSLAFVLTDDRTGESVDARVKVPAELVQWVPLSVDVAPGEKLFVRLHEVIRENAHKLYPGDAADRADPLSAHTRRRSRDGRSGGSKHPRLRTRADSTAALRASRPAGVRRRRQ
jgi:polyphosphate kinase